MGREQTIDVDYIHLNCDNETIGKFHLNQFHISCEFQLVVS